MSALASDFVRQISSPFTTRLALVFTSWADENIIRIETVQDAFVASFKESFFFLTSNKLLKNCLKCLKRLEVLLGAFRESTGTEQWPHSVARLLSDAVPLIHRDIFPSIYIRNMQREKASKIFSNAVERYLGSVGPDPAVAPNRLQPYNSAVHAVGIA